MCAQSWKKLTLALSATAVFGCQPAPVATPSRPDHVVPALIASHWIGIRLGQDGNSRGGHFIAGHYDGGPEEKIVRGENLLRFTVNDKPPTPGKQTWFPMIRDPGAPDLQLRTDFGAYQKEVSILPNQTVRLEWKGDIHALEVQLFGKLLTKDAEETFTFGPKTFTARWTTSQTSATLDLTPMSPPSRPRRQAWITIEGSPRDQAGIDAMLSYLYRMSPTDGDASIPPFGLSSDLYFGHIFWDADIWLFPALALLSPDQARPISEHRLRRFAQAQRNFTTWLADGRPIGNGSLGPPDDKSEKVGAKFPWESSTTGKETVPGPSRFQDHISGSVLWSLQYARKLGIIDTDLRDIERGVANFYLSRSEGTKERTLRGTMSPDEFHIGDNDLYTNILAEGAIRSAYPDSDIRFKRPRDGKGFLNYDGDRGRGYKQAAGVLAIYPLQDPDVEKEADATLNRFAPGVIANGPAMTHSIHALIHARLGRAEEALQEWREGWVPYTDHPFQLYSERKGGTPRTYFTTGPGGCLQAVLYGFVGIRVDTKPQPGSLYNHPLRDGAVLSIKPNLPSAWKSIQLDGVWLNGRAYDIVVRPGQVEVKPDA